MTQSTLNTPRIHVQDVCVDRDIYELLSLFVKQQQEVHTHTLIFEPMIQFLHNLSTKSDITLLGAYDNIKLIGFLFAYGIRKDTYYLADCYVEKAYRNTDTLYKLIQLFMTKHLLFPYYTHWETDCHNPRLQVVLEKYGATKVSTKYKSTFFREKE